jgi:hypothetical protein
MKRIWKYHLGHSVGERVIPGASKLLTIQAQDHEPTAWVEATPEVPSNEIRIQSVMTGQAPPDRGEYIATVQLHHGDFVLHYYLIP